MEKGTSCHLKRASSVRTWTIEEIPRSHRVVFSWNASRSLRPIHFSFSLLYDEWSPPQIFCEWGTKKQSSFSYNDPMERFQFFQDELLLLSELAPKKIKIECLSSKPIPKMFASFVTTDSLSLISEIDAPSIQLDPKWHYSQMALGLPYSTRICSPLSLINASSFFLQTPCFDIPDFIAGVYDHNFDIYGNWMLNIGHASDIFKVVEPKVQRLSSFHDILNEIQMGKPVVASVSGQLSGAPLSYPHGHLLVIYGWDNKQKKVLCIDSAADKDEATLVKYPYSEFMESWSKKFHLCYTF